MPKQIAHDLLARLGLALDRQEWDAWLAMYTEDATFWVPAWTGEHQTTQDVGREVSLMYHDSRWGLEERILRIRTRKSVTAMPLPRTQHYVSNVLAGPEGRDTITGTAAFSVALLETRTNQLRQNFGRYEFRLRRDAGHPWRIAYNRVVLINDVVPTIMDFYSL
jgi:3-phenylpropionate/cinnamic acid dioxygenase small subunit